jgi:hypothetical protein
VKTAVDEQLAFGELCRQIELAPDLATAACKHGLGVGLIPGPSCRQIEDPLQVGPGATVASALFGFAQCLADQVLGQDGILAMQLIGRL